MNRTSIEWTDFSSNLIKFRDPDGKGLREELIQVAAVAVAWVEAIDTPEAT